jgi:hypothetical protein
VSSYFFSSVYDATAAKEDSTATSAKNFTGIKDAVFPELNGTT